MLDKSLHARPRPGQIWGFERYPSIHEASSNEHSHPYQSSNFSGKTIVEAGGA
jgi:hypothetical protein